MPSAGSTSPFGKVDRHRKRIVSSAPARAPSSRAPQIGLVKVPDLPRARYPAKPDAPKDARSPRQMPLTNHLQPTSCHVHPTGHPDPRRRGSHLSDRRASTRFTQAGGPAFHSASARRRQVAIAGIPSPGWPMSWHPPTNRSQPTTPLRDARCPRRRPRRTVRSDASWVNQPTDALCRHPNRRQHPGAASRAKTRFPTLNHERRCTSPEHLPPTSPTSATQTYAQAPSEGRHQYPGLAAKARLPACFHAPFQGALDPVASGFSPRPFGPHVARQLLQQSAPRALQRPPRFPMGQQQATIPLDGPSLARDDRPSFLRSGVIGLFEHVDPRHGDRSPRRIYPNLTDSNTPCRKPVPPSTGKSSRATILRYGSLSDEPTRRVGTSPPHLLGPLFEAPRERRPRRAASGVPSTPRPARPCGRTVEPPARRRIDDQAARRLFNRGASSARPG